MPPPADRRPPAAGSPLSPAAEPAGALDRYRGPVLDELHALLDARQDPPFDLMRYHLGWEDERGRPREGRGGKLLRPALCLLSCEAVGGDWPAAVPAAAALELLHNFSLIHDDIEDASAERHGRATLWRLRSQAEAINAGDGMFALAHVALLRLTDRGHPAGRVLRAVTMLDEMTLRLCEGQHLDLLHAARDEISRNEYLSMIEGKSALMLAASCALGALLGGAGDGTIDAMWEFGRRLGMAFQVRDDYLGVWGAPETTGKPASDDLLAGKKSYPIVVALERASGAEGEALRSLLAKGGLDQAGVKRARALLDGCGARDETERVAADYAETAIDALEGLDLHADRRRELEALTRFAATRDA